MLKAKASSYSDKISVSESQAEVELQHDVLCGLADDFVDNLALIGKWGFDGSTRYSEYKQKVINSETNGSSLFVTSYVPLQLIAGNLEE